MQVIIQERVKRLMDERTEILSIERELTDEETLRLVQIENELGIT
jgi:hypothetical protein